MHDTQLQTNLKLREIANDTGRSNTTKCTSLRWNLAIRENVLEFQKIGPRSQLTA